MRAVIRLPAMVFQIAKLAATLQAAAAVALCLIQDFRAAEGHGPSATAPEPDGRPWGRASSDSPEAFSRRRRRVRVRPPAGRSPVSRARRCPPDRNRDLRQLAIIEQLEDDLA